ncbi:MFS transporter [Lacibacter luteus]|uniref:MFS transporter n=1 Tax=Lacibacter luteus TaxID=2508719 RepID=A0A4Q1CJU0_9BACT|nr:MFS transporter [Lacibacter luteus]RXK60886.1 MFS transporter [Lacibacter luteus]
MSISKPRLSFWQIINMNVGFFGIQYSFGLQQSAVNPIYDFLGAKPDEIPWLNLAGPLTGLIIQPIIGALSDKTWHPRFGRRTPYFFIGAMICSIALFLFPFSSALWMAAGLLWILDAGNNTAMEPYRAFIADKLDASQQPTGFQAQSFFTGFGQTLANISLFIFPLIFIGKTGKLPTWVFASFFLGAVCSIGSIWWSMRTTPEIPPTEEELQTLKEKNKGMPHPVVQFFLSIITTVVAYIIIAILLIPSLFVKGLLRKLIRYTEEHPTLKIIFAQNIEIVDAIINMPKVMWQLALVYLFQWYALFCYWQNSSKSIALSVWKTSPEQDSDLYEKAVSWTGLVNGWYNVITFASAFVLVYFAKKYSPKLVHFGCLVLAGIGLLFFPFIENKYLLFPAITGFGIGWASMMGIPYLIVVSKIPKERYGVYMGIINMMIVIPMFIQTTTFGFILKKFLGNHSGNAIAFAGVLLLIAALLTLFIKAGKPAADTTVSFAGGH